MAGKTPNMRICDLSGEIPWIGISTGTQRIKAEDSGIAQICDIKSDILHIFNSFQKPPEAAQPPSAESQQEVKVQPPESSVLPVSGGEFHFMCSQCHRGIDAEQRSASVKEHKKVLCGYCIKDINLEAIQKEEPKPESVKEKKEKKKPMKEEEKEIKKPLSDKELSEKLEAEEQKKALAKTQFKVGTCEAVAKQYGIPAELANMFFMTLNDGLYIKNPGLLHFAAKKGYSRIEVISNYNEKTQEWESESKIYPKVTAEMVSSICKLGPEMQKIAWEYVTAPTNGTGAASSKSVKMSTMQPFFKEMSQTRATNRALRNYTGYGGASLEELPEAEVKYIEG